MDDENIISFLPNVSSLFQLHLGLNVLRFYRYGVVSRESSVLIFGGACVEEVYEGVKSYTTSLITKYANDEWKSIGNLQQARLGHRTIANGDRIYIVGGDAPDGRSSV